MEVGTLKVRTILYKRYIIWYKTVYYTHYDISQRLTEDSNDDVWTAKKRILFK